MNRERRVYYSNRYQANDDSRTASVIKGEMKKLTQKKQTQANKVQIKIVMNSYKVNAADIKNNQN